MNNKIFNVGNPKKSTKKMLLDVTEVSKVLGELPKWHNGEESTCQCKRLGFDPWVRTFLEVRNSYLLQYSCLENPMDGEVWQVTVHGVAKSQI